MEPIRRRVYQVLEIAGPHDRESRRCDIFLITLIGLNVLATILESVPSIDAAIGHFLVRFEIFSVGIFSAEYLLRLWCCVEANDPRYRHPVRGRLRRAVSLMALIDLLAVAPFYLAAFVPIDLRFLRVLRILRILKLSHYFSALDVLLEVVRAERHAFGAALFLLILGLLFAASGIYVVEHDAQPVAFGSIPAAMWWAVATLTTVGYGDVTPVTAVGKVFGASITILGIGMVALPTGILASGFSQELARRRRIYGDRLERALEDGILDAGERDQLDSLREELGLSDDAAEQAEVDERRRTSSLPRAGAGGPVNKPCPHCGESVQVG